MHGDVFNFESARDTDMHAWSFSAHERNGVLQFTGPLPSLPFLETCSVVLVGALPKRCPCGCAEGTSEGDLATGTVIWNRNVVGSIMSRVIRTKDMFGVCSVIAARYLGFVPRVVAKDEIQYLTLYNEGDETSSYFETDSSESSD